MNTEFEDKIAENPEDHDLKLIYADYLEEQNDIKRANFWQIMFKKNLVPTKSLWEYKQKDNYIWSMHKLEKLGIPVTDNYNNTYTNPIWRADYDTVINAYNGLYNYFLTTDKL